MIRIAGGESAFGHLDVRSTPLENDAVPPTAPDILLTCWCGVPHERQKPEKMLERPGWSGVAYAAEERYFGRPGPRLVDGVEWHGARLDGYSAGGKTGTTLVSIPTGYALDATIASFVGFAPVEQPEIIMLIKIDEPKDDPLGGIVAAPVFAKLAPKILSYLNVQPTRPLAQAGR